MNHALLPSIANAPLPENYLRALAALKEFDRARTWREIDSLPPEEALAFYRKLVVDAEQWFLSAQRIRARAIRRCGEELTAFEKAIAAHLANGGEAPQTREAAARIWQSYSDNA
jgi:hypothetical protein